MRRVGRSWPTGGSKCPPLGGGSLGGPRKSLLGQPGAKFGVYAGITGIRSWLRSSRRNALGALQPGRGLKSWSRRAGEEIVLAPAHVSQCCDARRILRLYGSLELLLRDVGDPDGGFFLAFAHSRLFGSSTLRNRSGSGPIFFRAPDALVVLSQQLTATLDRAGLNPNGRLVQTVIIRLLRIGGQRITDRFISSLPQNTPQNFSEKNGPLQLPWALSHHTFRQHTLR